MNINYEHPKPGFYPDLPFADYQRIKAVNASLLVEGMRTMAHLRWRSQNPRKDTDALKVGRLTHLLVFEPDKFEGQYLEAPEGDKRKAVVKEAWADIELEAMTTRKEIVSPANLAKAKAIAEKVRDDPHAFGYVSCPGYSEASFVWKDEETGVLCKARIDHFGDYKNYSTVVDLKTTEDASEHAFVRQITKYNMDVRTAFYLDGMKAEADVERRWFWVVAEKTDPFCVAVYPPDQDMLTTGRAKYKELLHQYRECKKHDVWPGYPEENEPLSLPPWARTI